ncbi:TetR/AcrR family transcriptional regulator (plasmid) [Rhodococcus sp. ZPP]|uniref:TetR/AcrR family transcriptional regulator n=1 Tax=Rhodococcus sp. ZPP TaxID=2749906 RepID=UPI001AD88FB1|nr:MULTISPECIES: TetR/AcrR family transcriptional regulator [Rhodococcus]QTJ70739.1 TetR/AcrR family transcriptional regulator [Rhodococcus sp. ZPP]GLK41104.1 TetR family transcriptional regulator [Rhodococcus wratislaviensis]
MTVIRRSPYRRGQARPAILDCARTVFSEHGYHDASIKEVAVRAEVSETLVYRYFGSKSELFEESVIGPAREFVDRFLARWADPQTKPGGEDKIRNFVIELLDFAEKYEDLLLSWAAAGHNGRREIAAGSTHGQGIRRLSSALVGNRGKDEEMAMSLSIGLILSVVLLRDVLFAQNTDSCDPKQLADHITRYAHAGILSLLEP